MVKLLPTFTGLPWKDGTEAPKNAAMTQRPAGVPEKVGSSTTTSETLPVGAKVTMTWPVPT